MLRCPYETKKGEEQRTTKKTLGPIAKTHCIVFSLSVAAFSSLVRDGALILSFLLSFCFSFSRRKRYILSASKFATQASKPSKKDLNMKSEEATIEIQLLQVHRNTTLQLERGEKKNGNCKQVLKKKKPSQSTKPVFSIIAKLNRNMIKPERSVLQGKQNKKELLFSPSRRAPLRPH